MKEVKNRMVLGLHEFGVLYWHGVIWLAVWVTQFAIAAHPYPPHAHPHATRTSTCDQQHAPEPAPCGVRVPWSQLATWLLSARCLSGAMTTANRAWPLAAAGKVAAFFTDDDGDGVSA